MINVKIQQIEIPAELKSIFDMDIGMLTDVIEEIALKARQHWVNLADSNLHRTKREYTQGISEKPEMQPGSATLTLTGLIPDIVENGRDEINLRDVLLVENGRDEINLRDVLLGVNTPVGGGPGTKKQAKDGHYYRTIRFKRKSAGSAYRTISEKVPEGWIRPRTEGEHFVDQVADYVGSIAAETFQTFVDNLGK